MSELSRGAYLEIFPKFLDFFSDPTPNADLFLKIIDGRKCKFDIDTVNVSHLEQFREGES